MSEFKHFVEIKTSVKTVRENGLKSEALFVYPSYRVSGRDIMKKGGKFYAVLDRETGMWSQDEDLLFRIIDADVMNYIRSKFAVDGYGKARTKEGLSVFPCLIDSSDTGRLKDFNVWFNNLPVDHNFHQLDTELTFASTKVTPEMYRSKRLSYDIKPGSIESYDHLMSTLYSEENRAKLEWAIGSILTGESKTIDKMVILYSYPGFGKSTVLNIVKEIFPGYWTIFEADSLASGSNQFASAAFKDNPLVAIHTDGSLKKIESPFINQLVSHEEVLINEKNKSQYIIRSNAMLFLATNDLVDLKDTKVGITRRMLDVYPTHEKLPVNEYRAVVKQIEFEIPAIADHCVNVFREMGREYFEGYIPIEMIKKTNYLQNFFNDNLEEFSKQEFFTRNTLYSQFCAYCEESGLNYAPKRITFTEQLREYFEEYYDRRRYGGVQYRHVFVGLKIDKVLGIRVPPKKDDGTWIELKAQNSILDELYSDRPAQYAKENGNPEKAWSSVKTSLRDINTRKLHWLSLPKDVIRIDFDKLGPDGKKSLEENLKAAARFPPTYAEVSKSGGGLHLYYIYDGDISELSHVYEDHIEIKVASTTGSGVNPDRRMLTLCNDLPIATISSGLPLKEVKKPVIDGDILMTERGLRTTIKKCLAKEVHGDTTSNIDFIFKILEDAYNSDLIYDVSDMYTDIYTFAACASNQSERCLEMVRKMHFQSKEDVLRPSDGLLEGELQGEEGPVIIFDIEVFPNLLLVCWMYDKDDAPVVRMFNPSPEQLSDLVGLNRLIKPRLIGFNNRSYDNHIIYGRILGDSVYQCYLRSQRIINGDNEEANAARFRDAYNLSYADVYDFASEKMSLKKWEIKLEIDHQENEYPWDEPLAEEHWVEVADYCCNDVKATRAVLKKRSGDLIVRQALADLSGLTVNDTNRQHITKILVGNDRKPNHIYTNLATGVALDSNGIPVPLDPNIINSFPGYEYKRDPETGKYINWYRGTNVGRGGYVYAEPGMYTNVALLDVGNMHGASILALNKFGEYTKNYRAIREARMAIKHRDYDAVKNMFDGKLTKYLTDDEMADALQGALKLVLNSTYGIAAATFDNPLRDPRDKNNIIALRGALFMKTLQDEVVSRGYQVVHIKTDSIKIPNADENIINYIMEFGKAYGYEFEHEATYERMCLVNDAVYIAKYDDKGVRNKGGKHAGEWTATGAEFQHPYVFKSLFTKEEIEFKDMCETKSCTTALVLDLNEGLAEDEHNYHFVGKVGRFCPVVPGAGGGILYRLNKSETTEDGRKVSKYAAATGTSGYRWLEAAHLQALHKEDCIDERYYRALVDNAVEHISEFGDFEWFVNGNVDEDFYEFAA